jgi:hypothetical protein
MVWHEVSLRAKIRKECTQLTNCTASATFELVLKYVPDDDSGHWEISHIAVIISDSSIEIQNKCMAKGHTTIILNWFNENNTDDDHQTATTCNENDDIP